MICFLGSAASTSSGIVQQSNEAFVLSLPGKRLEVSLLVNKKQKFHARGGHDGALDAMKRLEEDGMGKLAVKKSKRSIKLCYFAGTLVTNLV